MCHWASTARGTDERRKSAKSRAEVLQTAQKFWLNPCNMHWTNTMFFRRAKTDLSKQGVSSSHWNFPPCIQTVKVIQFGFDPGISPPRAAHKTTLQGDHGVSIRDSCQGRSGYSIVIDSEPPFHQTNTRLC